jgi:hypothetical protein
MGFFSKILGLQIDCPQCGSHAIDGFAGARCSNRDCGAYNPNVQPRQVSDANTDTEFAGYPAGTESFRKRNPRTGRTVGRSVSFEHPLQIIYDNAVGVRKTFQADPESIRMRETRIAVAVEPTGYKICLTPERIVNWDEVDAAMRNMIPDFEEPLRIEYTNFRDERKTFLMARNSISQMNEHLSGAVSPSGKRINLAYSRIANWDDVEAQLSR